MGRAQPSALRIGVLPPGSSFVPFLADDIVAALELGLAESGTSAELVPEFADCNAEVKVLGPKVQQLLIGRRVACVVAPLNVSVMEKLAPHFQSRPSALVALSLGEDPLFDTARQPHLFVNTYQLWRAAWMCGYLGVQRFGPRVAMMVALHESGYSFGFAFQLGVEAAGGTLHHTLVTHRKSRTEDPGEAIAAAAAGTPDFIWAGYSGTEAVSFLNAFAASGLKGRIPLIGLPPLADGQVRDAVGEAIHGLHIVVPGPRSADDHPAITSLAQTLGRPPHPYARLAYETGRLIAAAADAAGPAPADLVPALRDAEFVGPRGPVRFDNGTERTTPFCLRVVSDGDAVEDVVPPPILDEQCALARKNLAKQGWVNPYLCA